MTVLTEPAPTFSEAMTAASTPLVGVFVTRRAPAIVEIAGLAGYDYVVVDLEHSVLSDDDVEQLARAAASTGMYTMVRVIDQQPAVIGRVAEAGVDAIMFPMVETAAQARVCVAAVHHPPRGTRGQSSLSRAAGFATGAGRPAPTCCIEIETREGVRNIAEILAVPGVDMVFLGPGDLRNSLLVDGGTPEETAAELARLIDAASTATTAAGVALGVPATYPSMRWDVERCREADVKAVTIGGDVSFLAAALRGARTAFVAA